MLYLTEHFTLEEACFSSTADRACIKNQPDKVIQANMKLAAVQLEKVRALLNNPIHIDSWFRSEALNKAIGGVGKSAHMDGWAIDFVCSAFGDPKKIAQTISKSSIKFDQCILEGSWVHISFDPKMRGQVLSAHFTPGQSTTYSIGV